MAREPVAYLKVMEEVSLLYEYDAINPRSVADVDFSQYDPDNPEPFMKGLEGKAQLLHGVVSAASPEQVVDHLNSQGLIPARIAAISGDKEGLVQLVKLKDRRNRMLGLNRKPTVRRPPPKKNLISPRILPYLVVVTLIVLGFISWLGS